MEIRVNKNAAEKNNISLEEVLLLIFIYNKMDLQKAEEKLVQKGFITAERNNLFEPIGWRLTNKGSEIVDSVILDSDVPQEPQDKFLSLAKKLKEVFPKGKKAGTNYYWADGVALISRRLKLFFKKYGNTYNDEQIIQAAEKYVQSYNGDYSRMRILKYFILKEVRGADGDVESISDLLTYIENAGQEENLSNDWTSNLN